jgi:hypothetical protein
MKRKHNKKFMYSIKRCTELAPKTIKATKSMSSSFIKKINYFLNKTVNTLKNTSKSIDKKAAKTIRSITKRRGRK